MAYRQGTRMDQSSYCQHSVNFINHEGIPDDVELPGSGNILFFNNGRQVPLIMNRYFTHFDANSFHPLSFFHFSQIS